MGHVLIANVSNFKIQGSSLFIGLNAKIVCKAGAALGFTFLQNHNVGIFNVRISNCSAVKNYEVNSSKLDSVSSYINEDHHILCYSFLASFLCTEIAMHNIAILHSRGVGFSNGRLTISKVTLAHNEVNCINFVERHARPEPTFSMSDSHIMFGAMGGDFSLSSGLNLFIDIMFSVNTT